MLSSRETSSMNRDSLVEMWLDKVEMFLIMNGPSQLSTVGNQCGKPSINERMSSLIKADAKGRFCFHSENGSSVSLAAFASYVVADNIADAGPLLESFVNADIIVMEVKWTENDFISCIFIGNPKIGVVCLDMLMCPSIASDARFVNILQSNSLPIVMFSPMKAVRALLQEYSVTVSRVFDFVDAHSVLGGDAGITLHGLVDIYAIVSDRSVGSSLLGTSQWHLRPCSSQLMDYCAQSVGYMSQLFYNMWKLIEDIGRLRDWEAAFPSKISRANLAADTGSGRLSLAGGNSQSHPQEVEDDDCTVSTMSVENDFGDPSSPGSPKEAPRHAKDTHSDASVRSASMDVDASDAVTRIAALFWDNISTLKPENVRTLENYYGLVSFFDYWKSCNAAAMALSPIDISLEDVLRHLIKQRKIVISAAGVVNFMFLNESASDINSSFSSVDTSKRAVSVGALSSNASTSSGTAKNVITSAGASDLSAESNPWTSSPVLTPDSANSSSVHTNTRLIPPNSLPLDRGDRLHPSPQYQHQYRGPQSSHAAFQQPPQGLGMPLPHPAASASPIMAAANQAMMGAGLGSTSTPMGMSPHQYLLILQQTRQEQLRQQQMHGQSQNPGGVPRPRVSAAPPMGHVPHNSNSCYQGFPKQQAAASSAGISRAHVHAPMAGASRALKTVPTRNEQLEANKYGVEVEYISMDMNPDTKAPVVCPVESTISVGVRIRNTAPNMLAVLSRVMISDRSLFRCESRFPIPIRLNPMEEISLTCLCTPFQSGIFNNVYIFDFGNFSIGRYVTVRAVGNDMQIPRPFAGSGMAPVHLTPIPTPSPPPPGLCEAMQPVPNPPAAMAHPVFPASMGKVAEILKSGTRAVDEENIIRELQAKGQGNFGPGLAPGHGFSTNTNANRTVAGSKLNADSNNFELLTVNSNTLALGSDSLLDTAAPTHIDVDLDSVDLEWISLLEKGSEMSGVDKFNSILNNMLEYYRRKSCTPVVYKSYFRNIVWGIELLANQRLMGHSLTDVSFQLVKQNFNCVTGSEMNVFGVIHKGEAEACGVQTILKLNIDGSAMAGESDSMVNLRKLLGSVVFIEFAALPHEGEGNKWCGVPCGMSGHHMYVCLQNTDSEFESEHKSFKDVCKALEEAGNENVKVNVNFRMSRILVKQAVEAIQGSNGSGRSGQSVGNNSLLFPDRLVQCRPLYMFRPLNRLSGDRAVVIGRDAHVVKGFSLFNAALNENQVNAVAHITEGSGRSAPYIITGPPCSGKTCIVIESALQLLTLRPGTRVLIYAHNDDCVDDIMAKLINYFTGEDIFRYVSPRVEMTVNSATNEIVIDPSVAAHCLLEHRVPDELVSFSNVSRCDDGRTLYVEPEESKLGCSVVVCSAADAGYFQKFHSAFHSASYDAVYIDDVEKISEMEALVCFSGGLLAAGGQLVLLGDDCLPLCVNNNVYPHVGGVCTNLFSRNTTHLSLLNRLLLREREHPSPYASDLRLFPSHGGYNPSVRTKLSIFYRSSPFLIALVNNLFYEQTLACGFNNNIHCFSVAVGDSSIDLPKFEQDCFLFPVVFHNVDQSELISCDDGAGINDLYNPAEVDAVLFYVNMLLLSSSAPRVGNEPLVTCDVAVMCNSKTQVQRVSSSLLTFASAYSEVFVGTADEFSPKRPYRCVIVSPVVNTNCSDEVLNEGLLTSNSESFSMYFNNMVCCSESLLVAVGCADVLQKNPLWATFVQYAFDNSSLVGVGVGASVSNSSQRNEESVSGLHIPNEQNGNGSKNDCRRNGEISELESGPPTANSRSTGAAAPSLCPPPGFGSSGGSLTPPGICGGSLYGPPPTLSEPGAALVDDVPYSMMSALLGNLNMDAP